MRHPRILRGSLKSIAAGWVLASVGCTHNHYYGNAVPVCGPTAVVPGAVSSSAVCDLPSTVTGGTVISQNGTRGTYVSSAPMPSGSRPPSVVVSESRSKPFGSWRRSDPDAGLAQTRVEGALDEITTR
ncbi:hypothetical protein [Singulisphaera sp. PoT]|uniref:hypothetical protein n=1 Tax=Singulisphaera sp. PoT TaxID=3411797 RepID=UPI003BF49A42